jgi:CheY-like chemotaxis protein
MEIFPNEYETASLLSDVVSIISLRMTEKNLLFVTDIDCGLPKKLYGDENRLRQILLNLLSNAVKYTPAGQISFTVKGLSDECGNQQLAFKIEDTGIGIREEETGKLFDDFSRLDYRKNRGIEGTGLGLAISMNLCRLMGGDIKVESTYGQGSIFTVYLSQKIIDPSPMAKVISPQEKRVLILDERPTSLESISLSLKNLNVPFKAVSDIGFFKSALNKNIVYPFILVSAQLLGKVLLLVRESAPESQLVILSDYSGTPLSGSRRSLATPVHVISLAALLNGQERASAGQKLEYQALFAAPSASVLLVDDIETNLMVAAGLLAPYRTKVDLCSSGREAVKLVMENSYDLIFMDHMMPDVDGIEATAMIRNNSQPYFQNVPIVALTANAVQGMKEMFLNNGFNDFLPKPIEIDKFNEIMNRWIPAAKRQKPVPERDEKSPELFRIDGIDTSAGLTRTGGSIKKYQEILGVFYQDVVKRLEKLKNVPGESELLEFTTEVHALKSASASIGGLETSSLAARLEEAGRNRDLKFIRENLPLFLANLTRISQAISKVISFLNPSRKDEKDCVLDDFCLRKLKEALASQKVRAVDDIIDHLIQRSGTESKELRLISDCVLLSDFDRAQKIVEDLLKTAEG